MAMFKASKERQALRAVLRLLVFLREAMKAEDAQGTTLYKSVVDHANLVALALPNKDRVSGEELEKILAAMKQGGGIPKGEPDKLTGSVPINPEFATSLRQLPERGGMVVLSPDQLRRPLIVKP